MKSLQTKHFDFNALKQKLSEHKDIVMAFVFGSAKEGHLLRPDSDVDIAIWLNKPPTSEDRLFLIGVCQDALQYEDIDLSFLNNAGTLLRFEAMSGKKLIIKDMDIYADVFSKTCRCYEDDMMRLKQNRKIWHEIHGTDAMTLFTIGFTKKSAEQFFLTLKSAGVKRMIDIRLNNVSQLAGFAKRDDLCYFLKEICGIEYIHIPDLAPTKEILDEYRKNKGDWAVYEQQFQELLKIREVEKKLSTEMMDGACLLCSEEKPEFCHRRLVAEYLKEKWNHVEIRHLGT